MVMLRNERVCLRKAISMVALYIVMVSVPRSPPRRIGRTAVVDDGAADVDASTSGVKALRWGWNWSWRLGKWTLWPEKAESVW
jgi:hypothetical protein